MATVDALEHDVSTRDLTYLDRPFLDPTDYLAALAWLRWTPPQRAMPAVLFRRQPVATLSPRDQAALDEWGNRYGISDVERDAWMAAGLSYLEPHLADQCIRAGLTVADLARTVDGQTAARWLKSGESAGTVQARLLTASA